MIVTLQVCLDGTCITDTLHTGPALHSQRVSENVFMDTVSVNKLWLHFSDGDKPAAGVDKQRWQCEN